MKWEITLKKLSLNNFLPVNLLIHTYGYKMLHPFLYLIGR